MTSGAPSTSAVTAEASATSPLISSTSQSPQRAGGGVDRVSALTRQPRCASAGTRRRPRKPVAPVTATSRPVTLGGDADRRGVERAGLIERLGPRTAELAGGGRRHAMRKRQHHL